MRTKTKKRGSGSKLCEERRAREGNVLAREKPGMRSVASLGGLEHSNRASVTFIRCPKKKIDSVTKARTSGKRGKKSKIRD